MNTTPITLEEELFCTRYELEILSGIVNLGMLERWVPGFCNPHTHKEHVFRYNWVKDFVKDKKVIDIACGTGYGSRLMATDGGATSVMACDIDERSVKYASIKNRHEKINFEVQDAEKFEPLNKADVIVSFETIEHLANPELFLKCVNNALATHGDFFVSTPISGIAINEKPDNIHHVREWGFLKFHEILKKHLAVKDIYLQLYSVPPKIDKSIIARGLRKTGMAKTSAYTPIDKLAPFKWQPDELAAGIIGREWAGYQIVHCKKK